MVGARAPPAGSPPRTEVAQRCSSPRSVPACFLAALQHGGRACVPGARRPRPPLAVAAVAADARARGRPGAESCHGPSAGRVPVSTPWPHRCLPAPPPPRCPRPRLPSRAPRPRTAWKPSTNEARSQGALRPAWRGPRALQTRPRGLAVSGGCRSRPAAAMSLGPGPGAGPVSSPHLGGGGLFIRTPRTDRPLGDGRGGGQPRLCWAAPAPTTQSVARECHHMPLGIPHDLGRPRHVVVAGGSLLHSRRLPPGGRGRHRPSGRGPGAPHPHLQPRAEEGLLHRWRGCEPWVEARPRDCRIQTQPPSHP